MTPATVKTEEMRAKLQAIKAEKEEQEAKADAAAEKELAEIKAKSLANPDDLSSFRGMGLDNIDGEDMKPPMLMMVAGIKNKSELKDVNGVECPDNRMFMKGTCEVLESIECYFIYIKKYHQNDLEKPDAWYNGKPGYDAICIRATDYTPFAIRFKKSSFTAPQDLITIASSKNAKPLFLYKTRIGMSMATNKDKIDFFKLNVTVIGIEDNPDTIDIIKSAAIMYNRRNNIDLGDDEHDDPLVNGSIESDPNWVKG